MTPYMIAHPRENQLRDIKYPTAAIDDSYKPFASWNLCSRRDAHYALWYLILLTLASAAHSWAELSLFGGIGNIS